MIFKVQNKDLPSTTRVLCWSFDGSMVLIQSTEPMENLEWYNDSDLPRLLQLPFWRQPCPGCEE